MASPTSPDSAAAEPDAPANDAQSLIAAPEFDKIVLRLDPVAGAPVLKRTQFKVTSSHTCMFVFKFLRKQLKYPPDAPLFLYCNSSFQPHPNAVLGDLYAAFGTGGELLLNYAIVEAWG